MKQALPLRRVSVLLAEDNDDDVTLVREALEGSRHLFLQAVVKDGQETLAYLRREGAYRNAPPPDILFLDLNLPGQSGMETLREIKADPALKRLPIAILTTSTSDRDVNQSYEEGAAVYIQKPGDFSRFREMLEHCGMYWGGVARLPQPGGAS